MPYSVEKIDDIIHINASGVYDFHDANASQEEALKFVNEDDLDKILVNIAEIDNEFKFTEAMQIIQKVPERFPYKVKHAVIFSKETLRQLTAEMSEDYSFNRGINVRVFDNEEDAITWLKHVASNYGTGS